MVKELLKVSEDDFVAFIGRRLQWWMMEDITSPCHFDLGALSLQVIDYMRAACNKVLPMHIVAAFLKSLANAWITGWRIGSTSDHCPYGCGHTSGDNIRLLLCCPSLQAAVSC